MYIRALLEGLFDGPPAQPELRQQLKDQAAQIGTPALHQRLAQVDPDSANKIHPNDLKRIVRALEVHQLTGKPISSYQHQFHSGIYQHDWTVIGLRRDRDENNRRINRRVKKMVESGLLDEVSSLLADPAGLSDQAAQAVGYAEIIQHLNGQCTLHEATEKIKVNSRRLAKRQRTWFRSFAHINWFDIEPKETTETLTQRILASL